MEKKKERRGGNKKFLNEQKIMKLTAWIFPRKMRQFRVFMYSDELKHDLTTLANLLFHRST